MAVIRPERPEDQTGVRRVHERAFGRPQEGALVDALRRTVGAPISLVAVEGDRIAGHIFFSPVSIEPEGPAGGALALGPMAVLPELQRRGIGSLLVRSGLAECRQCGHRVVVVLGHPRFYPQFGFAPASGRGLRCEYDVADEVFMVAELEPGALRGVSGLVKYRPEFDSV